MSKIYHEEAEQSITATINGLAQMCHRISSEHGFHEDHTTLEEVIQDANNLTLGKKTRLLGWFEATTEQAEIARMHSELSEWLESVRKDPFKADSHLPEFNNVVIEAADTIIRIFDTCAKRNYPIGQALLAKMTYNNSRPYKHGKNS